MTGAEEQPGSTPTPAEPPPASAPYVERLIIRNFRGIASCELELEPDVTVLAGRNNVGKSRIISALHLALGGRSPDVDDFTFGSTDPPQIELVLAPPHPTAVGEDDEFPVPISRIFADSVQSVSEDPLRERIAWRTTITHSAEGLGARAETRILNFDATNQTWVLRSDSPTLTRTHRSVLAVELINTGRDLLDELSRRGSSIRKILSDLEIPAVERIGLEKRLVALSQNILEESETLTSVRSALEDLHQAVSSIGTPALDPLPVNLDELARLISIGLDTGNGPIPLRLHGAGSRSLASLQVQGVLYDRRLGKDGTALPPAPVTLIEEPEAHLHPQAAMELSPLLHALRGQKIVTTHSSHLITCVDHRGVRLIRSGSTGLRIVDLGPSTHSTTATHRAFRPDLHADEMEKLKRLVERPFGELMFATAIVLGDGATERAFLPPILRYALGHRAHGLCVIDPGSLNSELATAAVKFAHMTDTPWFIFADSDDEGQVAVTSLLSHGGNDASRVIWINGTDADGTPIPGAVESMLMTFDEPMCRDACIAIRPDLAKLPTVKYLKKLKGSSGASLAQHLLTKYSQMNEWPKPIYDLVKRLEMDL